MLSTLAFTLVSMTLVYGQQAGTLTAEVHPALAWETCTAPGTCTTNNGKVVLDSNWRWLHSVSGSTNCYTGNTWDATLCPDDVTCAANCALDGADYTGTYGITASGNSLKINFVTGSNVGSRLYLLADDSHYQMFDMRNQEFTFDVDVSQLPCGLNGALYMSGMVADGGMAQYPTNKAGAAYGVGYCDSQCPRDLKFIDGQANVEGWTPSSNNANTGLGTYGSCCAEMDIWEANSISTALTPHSCDNPQQTRCTGNACGGTYSTSRYGGTSDPDGCDFNSYRMGNHTFYGPGMTVDTTSKFTVVTQFLTDDGTSTGTLSEIKRFYVQNGVVIPNAQSDVPGVTGNSITTEFCVAQKAAFNNTNSYAAHGGMASMSSAFEDGMVLVMSLWDDYYADCLWLDSTYPTDSDPTGPGNARGSCPITSGVPAIVESQDPNAYVIFENIKVGAINSTFAAGSVVGGGGGGDGSLSTSISTCITPTGVSPTTGAPVCPASSTTATSATPATTTSSTGGGGSTSGGTVAHYGQCGGSGYTGSTVCVSPYTCQSQNAYYSQCL